MNRNSYQIETSHYSNSCFPISASLLYFERNHYREMEQIDIDVFADFWSLAFLPANSPEISLIVNMQEIKFKGPTCFYIPAHSVVKWKIPAGQFNWYAILSNKNIISPFKNPAALKANINSTDIVSEAAVQKWLTNCQAICQIGLNSSDSIVAERVKNWIDLNYDKELLLSELSAKYNVSSAYLSREFKREYGLSPVEYRNKKRIYKAMQLFMFENVQPNTVAYQVGFNDYSRFTKNFHHFLNASPREFRQHSKLDFVG